MATNPRVGQVDSLLDDIQLSREELHGRVLKVRTDVLRIRHMAREAYDELMDIERELSGADEQSQGGELFQKVVDLRAHKSIRRRSKWDDKTFRRKSDGRHLEAVA